MQPLIGPLHTVLQLNTRLFRNCLADVDDAAAQRRPNERTNNLAFLAAHLIDVRYYLVTFLGGAAENPFAAQLENVRRIEEMEAFPEVRELLATWAEVTPLLEAQLEALDEDALLAPATERFPVEDARVIGAISFLMQHESYHIGQMALIRKFVGLPAMRY